MELNKKIKEDAAGGSVGGGAGGAFAMPLFSSIVRRSAPVAQVPKIIKYKKTATKKARVYGIKEALLGLFENDPTATTPSQDTTDVIAKLKSLENHERQDVRDTTTFGLEDDSGALIRVTIRGEQAEEFEKHLHALLNNEDDEALPEIAEILYKMKDKFDIVDVEWPEVEEDEEVDQTVDGEGQPTDGEMPPEGDIPLDGDVDAGLGDSTANPQDLLTQVIDMMKADAEARKADARAREAEAKNREAEAAIGQAQNRVKEEEQLLDMDTHNKRKKEEAKEAKRLAQLAQWKSEVDSEGGEDDDDFGLGNSIRGQHHEEEELTNRRPQAAQPQQPRKGSTIGGRVHPHDIARYILNRMR